MATTENQIEKAFQKQPTIFLNDKRRVLGLGKSKKELRYVRNVGLGFKTPKEVRFAISVDSLISIFRPST